MISGFVESTFTTSGLTQFMLVTDVFDAISAERFLEVAFTCCRAAVDSYHLLVVISTAVSMPLLKSTLLGDCVLYPDRRVAAIL